MDDASMAIRATTALSFAEAEARLRAALAAEGFGVLTEIDVAGTLDDRLGVSMEPYLILGACNPPLAHRALTRWPSFGLLMPCNVVLQEAGDHRLLLAFDPLAVPQVHEDAELLAVAQAAHDGLERAVRAVEQAAPSAERSRVDGAEG
jgi:uncharacterized protein (DUF302 family)